MGRSSIEKIRQRIAKTHELISGALHESAHTIYALLHLMKVNHTYIFENEDLGRVHGGSNYHDPMLFDTVQDNNLLILMVRADIGMSYAGLIGEKMLFQSISGSTKVPLFISEGAFEDNKSARSLIKKFNLAPSGPKRASFKRRLMRQVQQELSSYWDDVMLISHALFKKHRLSFSDLVNILTKKSPNKIFWKEQFKKINRIHSNQVTEAELYSLLTGIP
jgi:hypothetical protein